MVRSFSRALVTGGAGFLGAHLCEQLIARGVRVVCLDNFLTGVPDNVSHLLDDPGFELLRSDLVEAPEIAGDVDLILHFASPASPADYLRLPIETMKVGSLGTLHALELARSKGARFVLASTSEAYGDPQIHPQREDYWGHVNPVGPRGVYDEAKRFAEALTMAFKFTHGMDTAIVRIFNTYGPRMRTNDGRAIPTFISQALQGLDLTITGDGSQTRSVCYVDDLIRGVLAVAVSGLGGPVNVGNPHEQTVVDIAHSVIRFTGADVGIRFVPRPVDDPAVRRPDTGLIERELRWRPEVSWEEGLSKTVAWFRARQSELSTEPLQSNAPPEGTVLR